MTTVLSGILTAFAPAIIVSKLCLSPLMTTVLSGILIFLTPLRPAWTCLRSGFTLALISGSFIFLTAAYTVCNCFLSTTICIFLLSSFVLVICLIASNACLLSPLIWNLPPLSSLTARFCLLNTSLKSSLAVILDSTLEDLTSSIKLLRESLVRPQLLANFSACSLLSPIFEAISIKAELPFSNKPVIVLRLSPFAAIASAVVKHCFASLDKASMFLSAASVLSIQCLPDSAAALPASRIALSKSVILC